MLGNCGTPVWQVIPSIQFILSVAIFTLFVKEFLLRFVANYKYLKRNDMKRRMLVIISSTHKDFNLHEMS